MKQDLISKIKQRLEKLESLPKWAFGFAELSEQMRLFKILDRLEK